MGVQFQSKYILGEFELEPDKYLLRHRNENKHLPELPFQVLLYLVENRERYVSRQELLERFWNGSESYEETLTRCISTIRTELNDPPASPTYIETRKKVGYRYIGPVEEYQRGTAEAPGSDGIRGAEIANELRVHPAATITIHPTNQNGAPAVVPESKRSRYRRDLLLALVFVVIGGGLAHLTYKFRSTSPPTLEMTRLTSTGNVRCVAISPDGRYVAYALEEAGKQGLWLSQVAQPGLHEIVPAAEVEYTGITFSRDGASVYYVRNEKAAEGVLYQAPALGGVHRRLLDHAGSAITISPDGKRLAFLRRYPNNPVGDALVSADIDGKSERTLFILKLPDRIGGTAPAWSPDGKVIAFGVQRYSGVVNSYVLAVDVETGSGQPINDQPWETVALGRVAWLPDGSGLIVTVPPGNGQVPQIFQLAYPSGEAHRLSADLSGYSDVTMSMGSTVASLRTDRVINIWTLTNGDANRLRQLTFGAEREDGVFGGLSWTPDGSILYRSLTGGGPNLWIMSADGTGNRQLAPGSTGIFPSVSPDGKHIISILRDKATNLGQIWIFELDGSSRKQLSNGSGGVWFPQFSPDGKWVVYGAISDTGAHSLWRIQADGGGNPVRLTDYPAWVPAVSSDGKTIACNWLDKTSGQWVIAIIPFEGGPPIKTFDIPGIYNRRVVWTPDGSGIAVIQTENGVSNIWAQPIDGGPLKQLTYFKDLTIFNFAWSPDGKQLALSRGLTKSDVVLLSNFH
jgi:Tol biopolymer transport system component/DNA-binding winged helix-turn-helix (wHTH) protein